MAEDERVIEEREKEPVPIDLGDDLLVRLKNLFIIIVEVLVTGYTKFIIIFFTIFLAILAFLAIFSEIFFQSRIP